MLLSLLALDCQALDTAVLHLFLAELCIVQEQSLTRTCEYSYVGKQRERVCVCVCWHRITESQAFVRALVTEANKVVGASPS